MDRSGPASGSSRAGTHSRPPRARAARPRRRQKEAGAEERQRRNDERASTLPNDSFKCGTSFSILFSRSSDHMFLRTTDGAADGPKRGCAPELAGGGIRRGDAHRRSRMRITGSKAAWAVLLAVSARAGCAQMRVLVDQVGYEPDAPKLAIISGHSGDKPNGFELIDDKTGKEIGRAPCRERV